jgi:hypothetical protein
MKPSLYYLCFVCLICGQAPAQVSINADGSAPDNSAGLEIKFTDKGFLLPRLTAYQLKTIENPAIGLMAFNTDSLDIYVFQGTYWLSVLKTENRDTVYPWACGDSIPRVHVAGPVAPATKAVVYGTVTNVPGETSKCWITSNLGADHQAAAVNDATEASAGGLMYDNGDILYARGEEGHYWSTLQFSYTYGRHLSFTSGFCDMNFNPKSWGFSVRCISD